MKYFFEKYQELKIIDNSQDIIYTTIDKPNPDIIDF